MLKQVQHDDVRTDWTRAEIAALFDLPFTELVFRAAEVHRTHHTPGEVQLCTLLSIKTGGCPEDCGYCAQSVHADSGVEAGKLMDVFDGPADATGTRNGGLKDEQRRLLKQDADMVAAESSWLVILLWILLGVGLGVAGAVVYFTTRSIVPPLRAMTDTMTTLAGGNYSVDIPATERKDEVGDMAQSMLVFKENMIKAKEAAEREAAEQKAREARAHLSRSLAFVDGIRAHYPASYFRD